MNFLRLVCIVLMAMLISAAFLSCSKSKDIIPSAPMSESTPPVAKSIEGLWAGNHYGPDKSIPVYFSFRIKTEGIMEVVNNTQQVIGLGTWELSNKIFKGRCMIFSSGDVYSVAGSLNSSADHLSGTWGVNASNEDGGYWYMNKSN